MKIVCDACSAKYSIADDKVRGKVFKIRCKRCSNIIVVRGDSSEAGATPEGGFDQKETRVFDYSGYDNPSEAAAAAEEAAADGEGWHVVIDQEQVGPMTDAEVAQRFRSGAIDADTYVWREGFADWERLADVEQFAALASGAAATTAGDDGGLFGGAPVDESHTAQSDPADLFAAASSDTIAEPSADLFSGSGAGVGDGGGLFGDMGADEDAAQKLKGQRSENSVLFSLSNLASLASDQPSAAPSASSSSSSLGGGGHTTATTEGSGLIDIRSMAQVYLGGNKQPNAPASPGTGSIDDLPSFSPSAFEANAAVLLPAVMPSDDNKKLLYGLVAACGVLALAAVVLVVVVLKGSGDKVAVGESGDTDTEVAKVAGGEDEPPTPSKTVGAVPGDSHKAEPTGAGDKGAPENGNADAKTADNADNGDSGSKAEKKKPSERTSSSGGTSSKPKEKSPTTSSSKPPPPPPPSSPPTGGGKCDEISCLVSPNMACCKKFGGGGSSKKPAADSSLPERLSKSDVKSGMAQIGGSVKACGAKHGASGVVKVKVKVGSNGKVVSATPVNGDAVGRCVAGAAKRATFTKTQESTSFTYPFAL